MTKRRRERDRPKAGPDSIYNPNKRVALSYAEDEEEAEDGFEEQGHVAGNATTGDYHIEAYPDEHELEAATDAGVSETNQEDETLQRDARMSCVNEEAQDVPHKNEDSLWTRGGTRKNVSTNQWPALGSLSFQWEDDDEGEDEGSDGTEADAMEYLRTVRLERQNMPSLFKAPPTHSDEDIYNSFTGDTRGYIDEDAYIGAPSIGPILPDDAKTTIEPREAYTIALKARFLKQRNPLHIAPSLDALAALGEKHPISFPANNNAYADWHRFLRSTVPQASQICALDQDVVFKLLELIQKHYLRRESNLLACTSAWIWALLARLDDVGTMNNDHIYNIREFGKKAILVQLSFSDREAAEQLELAASGNSGEDSPAKTLVPKNESTMSIPDKSNSTNNNHEAPTATSPNNINEDEMKRENTLATLDTIIVLVGDIFGQRDLLEFRQPWMPQTEHNVKEVPS